ncbi:hypothetical protein [Jannaschia seosinensis]|uniref:hypothetical protein n=1 Tax=Jannaschia seosinensis TaxID=313367 RepID=UPI001187562F|nr:hypothetical protein [Jannaschia seosinensis]
MAARVPYAKESFRFAEIIGLTSRPPDADVPSPMLAATNNIALVLPPDRPLTDHEAVLQTARAKRRAMMRRTVRSSGDCIYCLIAGFAASSRRIKQLMATGISTACTAGSALARVLKLRLSGAHGLNRLGGPS